MEQEYATEGALAALKFGFKTWSQWDFFITAVINTRFRHVMEKIGMQRDSYDKSITLNSYEHALSRHIFYKKYYRKRISTHI